jgi:dipeptidyl aminopeptidase/acylaminoacyl peptidase
MTRIPMRIPLALACVLCAGAQARPLALDDLYRWQQVSEPRVSPDGRWVAYTVTQSDEKADEDVSHVWRVSWDGRERQQLTFAQAGESLPAWSPDGRQLAFLSARGDGETDQLWLLDLGGGEARPLTSLPDGVEEYAWSPDGRRIVAVSEVGSSGGDDDDEDEEETRPLVIDRLQFKKDEIGYLGGARSHLFVVDVASGAAMQLTDGPYNEKLPAWAPDGRSLAFASKRGGDPDAHNDWDIYRIEARPGAVAVELTTNPGMDGATDEWWGDGAPQWNPAGDRIVYGQGGAPQDLWYGLLQVAVVEASGGSPALPTQALDRNAMSPRWSPDGRSVYFLLEDELSVQLARVRLRDGRIERLTAVAETVSAYDVGRSGRIALVSSAADRPGELYALERGGPRQLTDHNRGWLREVTLAKAQDLSFRSSDGLEIRGLLLLPPTPTARAPHPTVLRLHGGPVSAHQHAFDFELQLFAANGYAVVAPNPRGSSGRGYEFQRRLFAEWGHVDVPDVLAAADHVVATGVADRERLAVGGWSYGAILTNYVIASDTRFRAAISGAGMGNMLGGYGIDEYVREWELELGPPWKDTARWVRLSYPFLHADRIETPTLFMCGSLDYNVPLPASEQMYQALRSLGVPTQLVIYPGQHHDFARPNFTRDAWQRYLDWYATWLRPAADRGGASASR